MHRILPFLMLLFTYLALSTSAGLLNLVFGVLIAIGILWLLRPRRLSVNWRQLPSAFLSFGRYVAALTRNVLRSGIHISRIVLHPNLPIQSGIVAVPPECDSELGRALGAHAISLPPGELFVEMDDDGTMYIHSLDVLETEKSVQAGQDYRCELMKKMFD